MITMKKKDIPSHLLKYFKPKRIYKPKDDAGIPSMLYEALLDDGWYRRSDIIWNKPNPMPESVSDRPTKSHEYLFLLAKSKKYYYDADAIREPLATPPHPPGNKNIDDFKTDRGHLENRIWGNETGRNKHTVWHFNINKSNWEYCQNCDTMFIGKERKAIQKSYDKDDNRILTCTCGHTDNWVSHFAAFSTELITPCILAGSPPKTCAKCGTPYKRQTEVTYKNDTTKNGRPSQNNRRQTKNPNQKDDKVFGYEQRTRRIVKNLGFHPQCQCNAPVAKVIVLDPFLGSGTTAIAAVNNSRNYIGIDISETYVKISQTRIAKETQQLMLDLEQ